MSRLYYQFMSPINKQKFRRLQQYYLYLNALYSSNSSNSALSFVQTSTEFVKRFVFCQSTHHHHHHLHHPISVMELGHLLTRSSLTYPEISSKVYHDSFCQLGSSVSFLWVIYFEAFYLHVVTSFSCIPLIFSKFMLFLTPLQF